MTLEAATKPDARMRPLADFVKMAAFMGHTLGCVPYALDAAEWEFVTGAKNSGDGFRLEPLPGALTSKRPGKPGPLPAVRISRRQSFFTSAVSATSAFSTSAFCVSAFCASLPLAMQCGTFLAFSAEAFPA